MADISPVAANVKTASGTTTQNVQFGEAVAQGQVVYLKSDSKYWLSDNSTTTLAAAVGLCVSPNATDGWGLIATSGDVELGATLALGEVYTVSSTAGAIHPDTALATTEILTIVGYGKTAALLTLDFKQTAIAHA